MYHLKILMFQRGRIGDGCWIGGGVIIILSVTIGKGTVIGAGSVVEQNYFKEENEKTYIILLNNYCILI